ncbi:MAG: enoyl-CoA hydratase/isomerase family protein [Rhizobiales bacterium]|nr:enoyl-CoA hydratase/isomerase family protein [Hyphomicrobiales bacterium]
MSEPEVFVERRGRAGVLTLNRPKALNALTLGMVRVIDAALDDWEADPAVACIVVRGAGDKAFCAGGDIRQLYDFGKAGDLAPALAFWAEEYRLNVRIKSFPKPYVALIDGIVMGGGVGVSEHGSHRVAGDRFLFAMPEVGIGFFPDVGATYFLPRLPGRVGTWLALTGERVRGADAVSLGLADAHVASERTGELAAALEAGEAPDAAIGRLASQATPTISVADRATIDACFAGANVAEILLALDRAAAGGSAFAAKAAAQMRTKSPTSLAIALRQMQIGGGLDFAEAMRVEYRIVSRVARGVDFYEGVRALIVDKDNAPAWSPADSAAVSPASVEAYFAPLGPDELKVGG